MKIFMNLERKATIIPSKEGEKRQKKIYTVSTSEQLLEEICESFGTELNHAEVWDEYTAKLVRLSTPVLITHPDGSLRLLQMQYMQLSPLESSRAAEVYNANLLAKKQDPILPDDLRDELKKLVGGELDPFQLVTNNVYIQNLALTVHRFEKMLSFVVYDIANREKLPKHVDPFWVNEPGCFQGEYASVHLTFCIDPIFFINQRVEPNEEVYDRLIVQFPKMFNTHMRCLSTAQAVHPIEENRKGRTLLKHDIDTPFRDHAIYHIHNSVPRELTLGQIQRYLKKLCCDSTLS
ncbi:MAG: hypothetical protein V1743_08435 [Nanoarchaeota archaeon]